jgi:hypothetical protein
VCTRSINLPIIIPVVSSTLLVSLYSCSSYHHLTFFMALIYTQNPPVSSMDPPPRTLLPGISCHALTLSSSSMAVQLSLAKIPNRNARKEQKAGSPSIHSTSLNSTSMISPSQAFFHKLPYVFSRCDLLLNRKLSTAWVVGTQLFEEIMYTLEVMSSFEASQHRPEF